MVGHVLIAEDGNWADFGPYDTCTAPGACAGGRQSRTRTCHQPTNGGNEVCPHEGNATETQACVVPTTGDSSPCLGKLYSQLIFQ